MINTTMLNKVYPRQPTSFTEQLQEMPYLVKPTVIRTDAESGFVLRYFVRVANDKSYIVEVDEPQYSKFSENPRFVTTEIQWKIVGKKESVVLSSGAKVKGVEDVNRKTVLDADLTFGGLLRYITNYLEYWFAEEV